MEVLCRKIGMLSVNCYIIKCPEGAIMIDPGDDVPALKRFVSDSGTKPGAIILTHGHFDHMLGAAAMKKYLNAEVMIGEADARMLYEEKASMVIEGCSQTPFEPLHADLLLTPGKIRLMGAEFEVIHTPGHTPGGIALYSESEKLLISGDTLFYHGYGRTDFPGGSIKLLISSLRTLLSLPDDTMVYPGHDRSGLMGRIKEGYNL